MAANKQTYIHTYIHTHVRNAVIHTHARAQCSHASVGLAQDRPKILNTLI